MKSEISFLLDLVLNKRKLAEVKQCCLERIAEIEQTIGTRPVVAQQVSLRSPQAQMPLPDLDTPLTPQLPTIIQPKIMGGEIATSGSSRGPRKW